jgi:aminoglycoside phosphotransferase (APT) family kinase protein
MMSDACHDASPRPLAAPRRFAGVCLPVHLQDFVSRSFGDDVIALPRDRRFGQAAVWSLERAGVVFGWLKVHISSGAARRELLALRAWAPSLRAPRVLAVDDREPVAFVVGHLPGVCVAELPVGSLAFRQAVRLAGRALNEMHQIPFVDADPLPLSVALRRRATSWATRAAPFLAPGVGERLAAEMSKAAQACEWSRVPCHRDFQPGNWILSEDHQSLTIIDFGHARADVWLCDLVKLFEGDLARDPELRRAWFEGYGRLLNVDESRMLEALGALHGVATLAWGSEHGDLDAVRRGRQILERYSEWR